MRKLNLFTTALSLATLLMFASCTKEGPEGPQGAAGPQGAPGNPGTPGAGVTTYSAWFTTTAANWVDIENTPPYWAIYSYDKAAPGVTTAIMTSGIVLSYMKDWTYFDDATSSALKSASVVQLPFMADLNFADYYDFVIPAAGTIKYLYKSSAPWTAAAIAGTSFRYVLIPGSVAGGRGINGVTTYAGYTAEELKAMPYDKVIKLFNIPAEGTNMP